MYFPPSFSLIVSPTKYKIIFSTCPHLALLLSFLFSCLFNEIQDYIILHLCISTRRLETIGDHSKKSLETFFTMVSRHLVPMPTGLKLKLHPNLLVVPTTLVLLLVLFLRSGESQGNGAPLYDVSGAYFRFIEETPLLR